MKFKLVRLAILTIIFLFGAFSLVAQTSLSAQTGAPRVDVLQIKGVINPVLAEYIQRGIEDSEKSGATVCVIQMDTPGGLDTAMRDIVQSITNAEVPVVVYVSPSGGRAASAGVFITLSAHVAAMSPNTAIGAAHPVAMGEQEISDDMMEKVVNDAAAYIRSIAASHGRNADWAESAVRESVSITETEALELNVIDMIAPTLEDLLVQLNGMSVTLIDGSTITINTESAAVNRFEMSWIQSFLFAISDPNIALILLSIGSLGIIAEIFNPGLIFPGVIGAISLLLAFYSLGTLPVNWTGVLLIILAFGLFVAEFFTSSFGLLLGGGLAAFILGALMLFQGASPIFQVDWWVIVLLALLIGGFVAFAALFIVKTYRRKATTGKEDLIGRTAVVRRKLNPEGTVYLNGELWNAISKSGNITPGEEVIVTHVNGLKLSVTKKAKE